MQPEVQALIDAYGPRVLQLHNDGMAAKLGLPEFDEELASTFFRLLYEAEADFTNSFRAMTTISHASEFTEVPSKLITAFGKELEETGLSVCIVSQHRFCVHQFVLLDMTAYAGGIGALACPTGADRRSLLQPVLVPWSELSRHGISVP